MVSSATEEDLYVVLESSKADSPRTLKRNYTRLIRTLHPDKATSGNSSPEFLKVQHAWEVLRDASSRAQYDKAQSRELLRKNDKGIVNETVDLEDMEFNDTKEEYSRPCRCGGIYAVSAAELFSMANENENAISEVLVQCGFCTLVISITFSVETSE